MPSFSKIVIADNMEPSVVEGIQALGPVVLTPANLKQELADAEVLIVRSATKVTEALLEPASKLKIVARAGVGLDNVDKAACEKKGIAVLNTPGASSNAVAEMAVGMMIALLRHFGRAHAAMKVGIWDKKACVGREISGKTLGLIGMGRIGRLVAAKAVAMGMRVIYTDPKKASDVSYPHYATVDELLPLCDIVSLHASMPAGSPAILNAERIAKMKPGSYVINTARGFLIDEAALVSALQSGQLAGAALDVYPAEPYTGPLLKLDNVLLTPHVAASTIEAQERIGDDLIAQLKQKLVA
ncbi:Glyoxylate reductase [uncultured archaeon]|nr:Glyoxylate reductase [uncultured archaeon]